MKYSYEEIDEHIQWLINFMRQEYPTDFELVIDSTYAKVRSTLETRNFLRADLRTPEGFGKEVRNGVDSLIRSVMKSNE